MENANQPKLFKRTIANATQIKKARHIIPAACLTALILAAALWAQEERNADKEQTLSNGAEEQSPALVTEQPPEREKRSEKNFAKPKRQKTADNTERRRKREKQTEQTVLWSKIVSVPALLAYLFTKRRKDIVSALAHTGSFFQSRKNILESNHFWRIFAVAALVCVFLVGVMWVSRSVWIPIAQEYVPGEKPKNREIKKGGGKRGGQEQKSQKSPQKRSVKQE